MEDEASEEQAMQAGLASGHAPARFSPSHLLRKTLTCTDSPLFGAEDDTGKASLREGGADVTESAEVSLPHHRGTSCGPAFSHPTGAGLHGSQDSAFFVASGDKENMPGTNFDISALTVQTRRSSSGVAMKEKKGGNRMLGASAGSGESPSSVLAGPSEDCCGAPSRTASVHPCHHSFPQCFDAPHLFAFPSQRRVRQLLKDLANSEGFVRRLNSSAEAPSPHPPSPLPRHGQGFRRRRVESPPPASSSQKGSVSTAAQQAADESVQSGTSVVVSSLGDCRNNTSSATTPTICLSSYNTRQSPTMQQTPVVLRSPPPQLILYGQPSISRDAATFFFLSQYHKRSVSVLLSKSSTCRIDQKRTADPDKRKHHLSLSSPGSQSKSHTFQHASGVSPSSPSSSSSSSSCSSAPSSATALSIWLVRRTPYLTQIYSPSLNVARYSPQAWTLLHGLLAQVFASGSAASTHHPSPPYPPVSASRKNHRDPSLFPPPCSTSSSSSRPPKSRNSGDRSLSSSSAASSCLPRASRQSSSSSLVAGTRKSSHGDETARPVSAPSSAFSSRPSRSTPPSSSSSPSSDSSHASSAQADSFSSSSSPSSFLPPRGPSFVGHTLLFEDFDQVSPSLQRRIASLLGRLQRQQEKALSCLLSSATRGRAGGGGGGPSPEAACCFLTLPQVNCVFTATSVHSVASSLRESSTTLRVPLPSACELAGYMSRLIEVDGGDREELVGRKRKKEGEEERGGEGVEKRELRGGEEETTFHADGLDSKGGEGDRPQQAGRTDEALAGEEERALREKEKKTHKEEEEENDARCLGGKKRAEGRTKRTRQSEEGEDHGDAREGEDVRAEEDEGKVFTKKPHSTAVAGEVDPDPANAGGRGEGHDGAAASSLSATAAVAGAGGGRALEKERCPAGETASSSSSRRVFFLARSSGVDTPQCTSTSRSSSSSPPSSPRSLQAPSHDPISSSRLALHSASSSSSSPPPRHCLSASSARLLPLHRLALSLGRQPEAAFFFLSSFSSSLSPSSCPSVSSLRLRQSSSSPVSLLPAEGEEELFQETPGMSGKEAENKTLPPVSPSSSSSASSSSFFCEMKRTEEEMTDGAPTDEEKGVGGGPFAAASALPDGGLPPCPYLKEKRWYVGTCGNKASERLRKIVALIQGERCGDRSLQVLRRLWQGALLHDNQYCVRNVDRLLLTLKDIFWSDWRSSKNEDADEGDVTKRRKEEEEEFLSELIHVLADTSFSLAQGEFGIGALPHLELLSLKLSRLYHQRRRPDTARDNSSDAPFRKEEEEENN